MLHVSHLFEFHSQASLVSPAVCLAAPQSLRRVEVEWREYLALPTWPLVAAAMADFSLAKVAYLSSEFSHFWRCEEAPADGRVAAVAGARKTTELQNVGAIPLHPAAALVVPVLARAVHRAADLEVVHVVHASTLQV
jgi:hypothetical protein